MSQIAGRASGDVECDWFVPAYGIKLSFLSQDVAPSAAMETS